MDKVSYALGLGIGRQLAQMGATGLNIDDFAAAIKDVLAGNDLKVSNREAQQIVQDYFAAQEEKINKQRSEQGKVHKEAGEKYLAENAKKDGVITLPSGLQYQVLKEGNGKKPTAKDSVKCHYEGFLIDGTVFDSSVERGEPAVFGLQQVIAGWTEGLQLMQEGNGKKPSAKDTVKCHYEGFLIDGTVFDSSVQRGEPATFPLQQVIAGWTEGLQLMQEGAKYRFFIPYRLAYGEGGAGASIPPFAALIFDVELIQVV